MLFLLIRKRVLKEFGDVPLRRGHGADPRPAEEITSLS